MQIRKLAAGDRILDYRILEKIGEGGFGEVFRAEHEVLGRIVAIKVPRDLEALSALRLEGVIQATLDHPAIVKTLEISISYDPPYVVMEHVDGMSLAEVIKREGPLHWKRGARILIEAARALKHAHERGVVHGDVKPGNVLVEPGEQGRVRLTDFGLGRVFEGPRGNVQISRSLELATSGAEVQGTIRYLAPEVMRGEPADERSDIYSWSVLLFEAITGKLPEGREAPGDLAKNTPRELDEVFEACFQRRERRPRSLDSSIAALEKLLTNGPRPRGALDDEDGRASRAIPFREHDAQALVKPISEPKPQVIATSAEALHVLRMLGVPHNDGALPAIPVDSPEAPRPREPRESTSRPVEVLPVSAPVSTERPVPAPPPIPTRATIHAPPPEVDLGAATRRARSDPLFLRWREGFLASVGSRFSSRPAGAGVVPAEGFDFAVGITSEGDPHHRIYVALVPYVDLEVSRRFMKAAKNVFEREKGVWEKEVTFALLARDIQDRSSVLSGLRSFSTGWWRRRRAVLYDLAANRLHATELGCDPRGNPLKRIFFDAVQEAAKQSAPPLPGPACRAHRECIRGGLVGIGLSLVAMAGLLTGAVCVEKAAHHRSNYKQRRAAVPSGLHLLTPSHTPAWNGPTMRSSELEKSVAPLPLTIPLVEPLLTRPKTVEAPAAPAAEVPKAAEVRKLRYF